LVGGRPLGSLMTQHSALVTQGASPGGEALAVAPALGAGADAAAVRAVDREVEAEALTREGARGDVGPFDQGGAVGLEVLLEAESEHLGFAGEAVEVHVVEARHPAARCGVVLVDQGEAGTRDLLRDAEAGRDASGEDRLA